MKLLLFNLYFGLAIHTQVMALEPVSQVQKEEIIQTISSARGANCETLIRSENELAQKYYYLAALEGTSRDTPEIQSLRSISKKELVRIANLHHYCGQ